MPMTHTATYKSSTPPARTQKIHHHTATPSCTQGVFTSINSTFITSAPAGTNPALGRFINRDPLGFVDGMSLYRAYFAPWNPTRPARLRELFQHRLRKKTKCEATCAKKGQVLTHTVTTRYDYNWRVCQFGWQTTKCFCREPAKDPGKYTAQQHAYLQFAKDVACRGAGSYRTWMTCDDMGAMILKNEACIEARRVITNKCYGGKADRRHQRV